MGQGRCPERRFGAREMVTQKKRPATLVGILIPADWNDRHEVIALALATADEKEYRIGRGKKGKELQSLLHRYVEVTGTVSLDEQGNPVMTVSRYIVKETGRLHGERAREIRD